MRLSPQRRQQIARLVLRRGPLVLALLAIVIGYMIVVHRVSPGWFSSDSVSHLHHVIKNGWFFKSLKPMGYELNWNLLVAAGGCPQSAMYLFQNALYCCAVLVAVAAVRSRVVGLVLASLLLLNPIVVGVNLTNWSLSPFFGWLICAWSLSLLALRAPPASRRWHLVLIGAAALCTVLATEYRWEAHYFAVLVFFNLLLALRGALSSFPAWLRPLSARNLVLYGLIAVALTGALFWANKAKDEAIVGVPRAQTAIRYACTPKLADLSGYLDRELIPTAAMPPEFRGRSKASRLRFYRKYHATSDFYSVAKMVSNTGPGLDALERACRRAEERYPEILASLHLHRAFVSFFRNGHTAHGITKRYRLTERRKTTAWLKAGSRPVRSDAERQRARRKKDAEQLFAKLGEIETVWDIGLFTPFTVFAFSLVAAGLVLALGRLRRRLGRAAEGRSPAQLAIGVAALAAPAFFAVVALRLSNLEFRYFVVAYILACLAAASAVDHLLERRADE